MTGEEVDPEARYDKHQQAGSDLDWQNIVDNLLTPIKRTHAVDVHICVDEAGGPVPHEISHVFTFPASDQVTRQTMCVEKIKERYGSYAWFIRMRPDFYFYREFPRMSSFRPGFLYTRFQAFSGISGITNRQLNAGREESCRELCNFTKF